MNANDQMGVDLEDTETGLPQNAFQTPTRQDSNRAAANSRAPGAAAGIESA